ncbi:MAG: hypothetical protein ACFFG0_55695 [Candidatus Thorarchaeota archaeon]
MCKLLNLDTENEDYLSILETGQCIIRVNSIKRPFLLSTPLIQKKSLSISEINETNSRFIESFEIYNNRGLKKQDKTNFHNLRKFKEKKIPFLRKLIKKIKSGMRKLKKKYKKKNDDLFIDSIKENEEDSQLSQKEENYSFEEDFDNDRETRAYESLKNYIQELYEEQQKKERNK